MSLKKDLRAYLESDSKEALVGLEHGFGSLKEILDPNTTDLDIVRIKELLVERYGVSGFESFKSSLLTSYYTPVEFVQPVVESIVGVLSGKLNVLEPAAGLGVFLTPFVQAGHKVTAIEKDVLAGGILTARNSGHENLSVIVGGFEKYSTKQHYDLVISNVPFGNYRVFDPEMSFAPLIEQSSMERIHDYYMVKSLKLLRNDGLMAMVVPSGFTDSKGNAKYREYLVNNADLVFANRLPIELFKSAGTQASSDFLVFQRKSGKSPGDVRPFEELFVKSVQRGNVVLNGLFSEHPRLGRGVGVIGGQYENRSMVFEYSGTLLELGREVAIDLSAAFERQGISIEGRLEEQYEYRTNDIELPSHYRPGNLLVLEKKVFKIRELEPLTLEETGLEQLYSLAMVEDLLAVKDAYKQLAIAQGNMESIAVELDQLNSSYEHFLGRHTFLSDSEVSKLIASDADAHVLDALEVEHPDGSISKADLFFESFYRVADRKIEDLSSAVLHSLNLYNGINLSYLEDVTGFNEKDLLILGVEQGRFYQDFVNGERVVLVKEEFLSGDVVGRIARLEGVDERLFVGGKDEHMRVLKEIEPKKLPAELLDLQLGERWIDLDIYEGFAKSLFKVDTTVMYVKSQDSFRVNLSSYSSDAANKYASPSSDGMYNGNRVMEYAMLDLVPEITMSVVGEDGEVKKVPDVSKIREFEKVSKGIRDEFKQFVLKEKGVRERLEDKYHRLFNNVVLREYDGSHLSFKGLHHFTPKQHQKDAVWMLMQRNGGMVDHKVGKGKTLVIAMAAMEMKRLGIVDKPMAIGIKANTEALYNDFRRAYPEAKLLYPTDKDFEKKNRKIFFQRIANEKWDCILMTHDQFGKIQQSLEVTSEVIKGQIAALTEDLLLLKGDKTIGRRELKGLETRKLGLEAKLEELSTSMSKDSDAVDFVQMGIDHLFVDESHQFKNLAYSTRHTRVSGLGDAKGSQRALNMLIAIKTLNRVHKGDKGATFLSGTPISNSLNELYTIFQYLRADELERKQLPTFDAWASVYCVRSSDYEYSVTGEIKRKDRFREYVKVPELARMYSEIAHVEHGRTNEAEVVTRLVTLEASEDQIRFNEELIEFANTRGKSGNVGKTYTEKESSACMLIATNLSKKSSTDMRLIDPSYDRYEKGKLVQCANVIKQKYDEWNEHRGTQMVFCDIGVPNKNAPFTVYDELKSLLVERGVPPHEIAFMQDHGTKRQKTKIISEFNAGNVRVLMGSTPVLGTGVNGQKRGVAMHSLDLPWRPSDLSQRSGRFGRPDNWIAQTYMDNKVEHYIYASKKSLDVFQFQLLETKANFIAQIKNASISDRRIDEGAIDIEGGMNFSEYRAMLVGDDRLLERARLDRTYKDLLRDKDSFFQRRIEAQYKKEDVSVRLERLEKRLPMLEKDKLLYDTYKSQNPDIVYSLPVVISGNKIKDVRTIGEELLKMRSRIDFNQDVKIGEYGAFEVYMKRNVVEAFTDKSEVSVYVKGSSDVSYTYGNGIVSEVPGVAGKYIAMALDKLEPLLLQQGNLVEKLKGDLRSLNDIMTVDVFPREKELMDLKGKIEAIDAALDVSQNGKDQSRSV